MAELLRSAFGYFASGSGDAAGQHELLGRTVQLSNDNKLTIKKVLAEGGFGYVFLAVDARSGKPFALKRLCVDSDHVKSVRQEIDILKQLSGHPHIIRFVDSVALPRSKTTHGNYEFLIQTELCVGGPLVDIVNAMPLQPHQVLRVFYQTCLAVHHMHSMTPPIIHRDLKVENLLLDGAGAVKLCDFGSATTERVLPDDTWTHTQRGLVEEEIHRNTTPMYRTPEMVDLYSNCPITEKADVWALGCLLYKLCFMVHPFEDSGILRIINANYSLPEEDKVFGAFHGTIRSCLCVDPEARPSVAQILDDVKALAVHFDEDLGQPPREPLPTPPNGGGGELHATPPEEDLRNSPRALRKSTQQIWGRVKGGAGQLFKNIKDTSSRVMSSWGGKSSLDLNYISSRIIVMSFPGSNLDEVRNFLDTNHPEQYLVFNLSDKSYDTAALHGQVADFNWPSKRVPDLEKLVDLCRSFDSWLRADKKNVIVVHCNDGRLPSGTVVAAYLLFVVLFSSPQTAYKLFSGERCLDGRPIHPPPSHLRYLSYISRLVAAEKPYKPHSRSVRLRTLRITCVPLMDKERSLCQPYVEVFVNGGKVHTSVSKGNLKQIKQFTPADKWVEVELGVAVKGNVVVCVHHIKSVSADGTSISGAKMFQIQFHSGFIDPGTSDLVFGRSEVDGSSVSSVDKYPEPFLVGLEVEMDEREPLTSPSPSWQNLPHPHATPLLCFATRQEELMVGNIFSQFDCQSVRQTEEDNAVQTQTYCSIVHGRHGNQVPPEVADPLVSLGNGGIDARPTVGAGGSFFTDLALSEDPAVGYTPFGEGDDYSSSSSDEEDEEEEEEEEEEGRAVGWESRSDVPHNLLLDPVDPPTGDLLNLGDSPVEFIPPHVEVGPAPTTSMKTAQVGTNSGFSDDGDILGLGIASSNTLHGDLLDPFGDTSSAQQQLQGDSAFSLLSPTPMKSTPAPPTQPQAAADADFMTFANPAAFSDLGTQFHSQSTAGPSVQTQFASQPRPDPFAGLTTLGTQLPTKGPPKPKPTSAAKIRPHPVPPPGQRRPVVGVGSRSHGSYTSVIGRRDERGTRSSGGPAPLLQDQHFSDLLGSQGFSAGRDRPPQTLKDLKGKQDIENALDPETAKVREWAEGKKRNIRALLCDLHSILWEGEERWKAVQMKDLVTADQVKKSFRKACLSVHPDKTSGTEQGTLAEAIFVELNKAYALFEESGAYSLY